MINGRASSKRVFSKRTHPAMWVAGLVLAAAIILGISTSSATRIAAHQNPMVNAAMEMKYHAAESHLWLEEAITAGDPADLAMFRDHLDQAKWYARAMMDGEADYHGEFIPLSDPRLRGEIETVLQVLEQFDSSATERWNFREESGIGTEADQHLDVMFRTLIDGANRVEAALQQVIGKELHRFHKLQGGLMVLALVLGALVIVLLHVYERQKKIHVRTLQKSEENLSVTIDSIGDGMIAADTEGRITRINPVAEKLTGWTFGEAVGQLMDEVFRIVSAESRQVVENPGLRALREGAAVGLTNHMVLINRNGTETQIADSAAPIYNLDGKIIGVVMVFRDVTELYAKEEVIRKSERKYRAFFETSVDAMLIIEGDKFVDCNDAAVRMLRYDEKRGLLNTHPSKLSPATQPDGQPSFVKAEEMMALAREHGGHRFEWMHLRKDGTEIPIEVSLTAIESTQGMQLHTVWRDLSDRKRSEAAVLASEEKYRGLVEASSDWIWELDEEGKFSYASPQVERILGYKPQELIGRSFYAPMPPEQKERIENLFEPMWQNALPVVAMGNTNLHKDGHKVILETSATPILNEVGQVIGYRGIDRDITKRKQAEERLRESMQKLALHVKQTPLAVIGWDTNFEVTEWNPAAERMFGYSRADALGQHVSFIVSDVTREQLGAVMRQLLANTGGSRSTNENITRSGELILCEWYNTTLIDHEGEVIGITSLAMDVTARKKAEEERERLMLAIEQTEDIVVITDAEANIQYVNPAFEKVTGYSREEALGQNPRILQSGELSRTFYKKMWGALTTGRSWSGQLINKKKDGTVYTEEATISPVMDEAGKIINYVAAKRDATHELELEEQLRQAQKMEAVGQMAGGIAHDFNNLLQVISGYVELSEISLKPDDTFALAVQEIGKAAERGKGLVSQLLAFSRRQVIKPTDIDLNDLIDPLLIMIRGLIGEHIELDFIPCRELGTIHADRGLMEQVLINLCVNARDAMSAGGKLTIETENIVIDGDDARTNAWAMPGRYVLLNVTDTGCGMDGPTLERAFEPFYTTKEVGKGTGLGLSTVFGIIKQHNGHINTYSELGKGTRFKIYLPTVARKAAKVSRESRGAVVGGTETILVAEDDETVLALAKHLLSFAGYTVLTAADGEEAIRVFEEHADEIDVVMFDVIMPRLGGKQALDRILELRPGLPHLFASGYSEDAVHTNFIQKRGLHLLAKPYQTETLLRKIREVLDEQ